MRARVTLTRSGPGATAREFRASPSPIARVAKLLRVFARLMDPQPKALDAALAQQIEHLGGHPRRFAGLGELGRQGAGPIAEQLGELLEAHVVARP